MALISALLLTAILLAAYWILIRQWFFSWGASRDDLQRIMRGDHIVEAPTYAATLAVTIDAPPECIWPWLPQFQTCVPATKSRSAAAADFQFAPSNRRVRWSGRRG
jgi:hypothetical protein